VVPQTVSEGSKEAKAIANLETVTVAEETAGPNEDTHIAKADQLQSLHG